MNEEIKLKLQARLDGELSEREAREISAQINNEGEARALFAELQFTKTALHGNELELKLPESREFYWSKIQREIERGEKIAPVRQLDAWWKPIYMRWIGGVAAACALLMISFVAFNAGNESYATDEVEGTSDEMGAISYHSDKEGMTVVYLFDREGEQMVDSN
jgi:anti-sigma factor RsiW